jgi:Ca2+-binding RTX toxin-like protein
VAVGENTLAVATLAATDADGTLPTWRIAGGADSALFTIDAGSGTLAFLRAQDFEAPEDANLDNRYEVTVEASDGTYVDAQALTIAIGDVNEIGRTITGTTANNVITPTATAALRTTALNDTIYGLAGDDTIDGGGGEDYMDGGAGNDAYTVDKYSDDGRSTNDDIVVELAGGGIDRVNTSLTYRLTNEVENLTQLGIAAISGYGNALDNQIIGNAGANLLSGAGGTDTILGNDGNDTLDGGDGNDLLVGGAGADSIFGGAGVDKLDGGLGSDRLEGGTGDEVDIIDQ